MESRENPAHTQRPPSLDTLRLSDKDQQAIIDHLEKSGHSPVQELRRGPRMAYGQTNRLAVEVHHPGGTVVTYLVRARNLSQTGMAFLHGGFIYLGTHCLVLLRRPDGTGVRLAATVVRCRHVTGRAHEVAVRFSQPVVVNEFVTNPCDATGQPTPLRLAGRVLYIADSVSNEELMKFQLGEMGVDTRTASSGAEALTLAAATAFDLVITEMRLPGMTGSNLAAALRAQGFGGAILALTADERKETRVEAIERGCTRVIVKPVQPDQLTALLREYLRVETMPDAEVQQVVSTAWDNPKMRPLILAFLGQLDGQVRDLGRFMSQSDSRDVLENLTLSIKGAAGGYGYPQISAAAGALFASVLDDAPVDDLKPGFAELDRLCTLALGYARTASTLEPAPAAAPTPAPTPEQPDPGAPTQGVP